VSAAANRVLQDALSLSAEERMELVSALSDSLEPPTIELTPEWRAEIEDRIAQIERGEVEPVSWEAVDARIRATLARR
jgi:putative addiction module component (TIGR02574 family)